MARVEQAAVEPVSSPLLDRLRDLKQQVLGGEAFLYFSMMGAHALGYVLYFILARVLSVEEYGEIVTLTASIYLLAVVVRSVQAQAAQMVSEQADSEEGLAHGYVLFRSSLPWTALGAALVFVLVWAGSPLIADYLQLRSTTLVLVLAAYLAASFILPVPRGLLLGLGRLRYAGWDHLIEPIARLVVAIILVLSPMRAAGVLMGYFVGKLAAYLFAVWPFLRVRDAAANIKAPPKTAWKMNRQLLLALLANSSLMALSTVDPFAIKHFFSPTVAGRFAVAFLLGRVLMLSTTSASWVTFSTTVKLKMHDPSARKPLLRGLALGGGIAGLVTLAYWLAPRLVVSALGGEGYEPAIRFVGLVSLEMILFTLISIQAYYHIAVRNTRLLLPFAVALVMEIALLSAFHGTPEQVVYDTLATLGMLFVWTSYLTLRALSPRESSPRSPAIGVVTRSDVRSDPRPRREAEALLAAGWEVDIIHVPSKLISQAAEIEGARTFAVPNIGQPNRSSKVTTLINYAGFFLLSAARLSWEHLRSPYTVVHVHNMPDFLVFVAIFPRLMGAKVVLDIHDLMPELASMRFGVGLDHPLVKIFRWIERTSARFSTHVITAGEPFRRRLAQNGIGDSKMTSVMNTPDPRIFSRGRTLIRHRRRDGAFTLVYHGSLLEYNDLEVVLRAVAAGAARMPDLKFLVYGDGRNLPRLQSLTADLGLIERVTFVGKVPLERIPGLIAEADLGVAPQCRSAFTSLNYPTKVFEYVALGIPVVMARNPALAELFGNIPGIFFEPENPDELAEVIWGFYRDPSRARIVVGLQTAACESIDWDRERRRFVMLMDSIVAPGAVAAEWAAA